MDKGDLAVGCVNREAENQIPECPLPGHEDVPELPPSDLDFERENSTDSVDGDSISSEDSISSTDSSDSADSVETTQPRKLKASSDQAGGHAGTIFKLAEGRLAKLTYAFDDPETMDVAVRHVEYAKVEYEVYMEMWCLNKLSKYTKDGKPVEEIMQAVTDHPMRYFVKKGYAWAPTFYGVCKVTEHEDQSTQEDEPVESDKKKKATPLYIVQENMLDGYEQACQVDLKLGFNTVEPIKPMESYGDLFTKTYWNKLIKNVNHNVINASTPSQAEGARLAGFKVFNPFTNSAEKMQSKLLGGFTSLQTVLDTFFDRSGHTRDAATMEKLRDKLLSIASWWADEGAMAFRAVAMSVLMAYECAPDSKGILYVSDIEVKGNLPVMDSNSAADPYVFLRSLPEGSLFPVVEELDSKDATYPEVSMSKPGKGDELHGDGVSSKTPFVNGVRLKTLTPRWEEIQFALEYDNDMREVVLSMHDKDEAEHPLIGSVYIRREEIPNDEGFRQICRPLETCRQCKLQDVQPQLCFKIRRDRSLKQRRSPNPRLKLIDFAHFYTTVNLDTSAWTRDGVTEGFLSAVRQFDRKIAASDDMVAYDGAKYKCPSTGHENMLTLETCKRYAKNRGKKYVTWRNKVGSEGACRACDVLVRRSKGMWGRSGDYQIFKLGEAACKKNAMGECAPKKVRLEEGQKPKRSESYNKAVGN